MSIRQMALSCGHAHRVGQPCPYCPRLLALRIREARHKMATEERTPVPYRTIGGERIIIRPRPIPPTRRTPKVTIRPRPIQPTKPQASLELRILILWARLNLLILWPIWGPLQWIARLDQKGG